MGLGHVRLGEDGTLPHTAAAARSKGDVVAFGVGMIGVCVEDIANAAIGPARVAHASIIMAKKATGANTGWTKYDTIYFDGTDALTAVVSTNQPAGTAAETVADGVALGEVMLNTVNDAAA
jgi:hypothetical protein